MALQHGKDYVSNVPDPTPQKLLALANRQDVGSWVVCTPNYYFSIGLFDTKLQQESLGDGEWLSRNIYTAIDLEGKSVLQLVTDLMRRDHISVEEFEGFVYEFLEKLRENAKYKELVGDIIDIQKAEKFKVTKLWVGGGSVKFKYPGKRQRAFPIMRADLAKAMKKFYLEHGRSMA